MGAGRLGVMLTVVACAAACATAVPNAAHAAAAPTAESVVELQPLETGATRITHHIQVDLPANDRWLGDLVAYEPEDAEFRYALARVLDERLPFDPFMTQLELGQGLDAEPAVRIDQKGAHLTLAFSDRVYDFGYPTALLRVGVDGETLSVQLDATEPLESRWTVRIVSPDGPIRAAGPRPVALDREEVRWQFEPSVDPPDAWADTERAEIEGLPPARSGVARYLRIVTAVGAPGIVVFLAFAWLWRTRVVASSAIRPALRATGAAALLVIAVCTAWVLNETRAVDEPGRTWDIAARGAAGTLALAAAALLYGRHRGHRLAAALLTAIGAAGLGVLVLFGEIHRGDPVIGTFDDRAVSEGVVIGGAIAFVAALTLLCGAGIGVSAARLLPVKPRWMLRPHPRRFARTRAPLVWIAGLSLVAGATVQWALWSQDVGPGEDTIDRSSARFQTEVLDFTTSIERGQWVDRVAQLGLDYPLQIASLVAALAAYVAVFALVRVMFVARTQSVAYSLWRPKSLAWPATLLFATLVAGAGGYYEGWGIPLAFVLSLLGVRLALHRGDELYTSAGADERGRRSDLLRRTLEIEARRRDEMKLYGEYEKGDVGTEDYLRKREVIEAAIRRLGRPRYLAAETEPRDFALALGAEPTWWRRGNVALATGAKLSLLPLAFFVYVVIDERLAASFAEDNSTGALRLFESAVSEVAFWLGAAWLLGVLYPHLRGINGPLKGLSLAAVYAASQLIAALVLPDAGTAWQFRALELALFLSVLGTALDLRTVRGAGLGRRQLFGIYRLADFRVAAGYGSSAAIGLIAIAQQVATGAGSDAITEIAKSLPSLIPPQ